MPKSRSRKKTPKRVLALPDLEQAKTAVLSSLTLTPAASAPTTTPSVNSSPGTARSRRN